MLLVSGSCFGETCGSMIHKDSFETPNITTYNDPSISGATDDGMNFTRIESTGLDWLDLTITFNLSFNSVNNRIADPTDKLFGLRYATTLEVHQVLLSSVYQLPLASVVTGVEPAMAFIENFGKGLIAEGIHFAIGIHPIGGRSFAQSVIYDCPQNQSATAQEEINPADFISFWGHFLVREIP